MSALYRTIVRPIITERTSAAYQDRGEYTFEVAPDATKHAIKAAVEQLFGVKVTGVWTSIARGKTRRVGQSIGRRPHTKKAIVKLLEGEDAAYDVGAYRDAPPGLRIWCGATVDTADIEAVGPWLDWAWEATA